MPYDIYVWDSLNGSWVNNGAIQGIAGEDGPAGVTFTPSVDASGNLSWTNDGGLENPETRNIIGPPGETGATGTAGASAYDKAAEAGYTGTEATFYAALTAMPYHNARHLPDGADPIIVQNGNIANAAVTAAKIAANAVSVRYTASVDTSWIGTEAPYTKTIIVNGLLASDHPTIDIVLSDTYETAQEEKDAWSNIYKAVAGANSLTLYAEDIPQTALTLQMECVRK